MLWNVLFLIEVDENHGYFLYYRTSELTASQHTHNSSPPLYFPLYFFHVLRVA